MLLVRSGPCQFNFQPAGIPNRCPDCYVNQDNAENIAKQILPQVAPVRTHCYLHVLLSFSLFSCLNIWKFKSFFIPLLVPHIDGVATRGRYVRRRFNCSPARIKRSHKGISAAPIAPIIGNWWLYSYRLSTFLVGLNQPVQSTPLSIYEAVLFDEVIDFLLHSGERDS